MGSDEKTATLDESGILRPSEGSAWLIDGKRASENVLASISEETRKLAAQGVKPGLAVILVGEDPASQVYVKSKSRTALACGFHSVQHDLPAHAGEDDILALIAKLNADPAIHGILLQLPLPNGRDATRIIESIDPAKDVDGLHPLNAGLLAIGDLERALVPCTPAGCVHLLDRTAAVLGREVAGAHAVVVGRSNLVGKPIVQLLLARNATVTIAHSKSRDLPGIVGSADILVAAVGRPQMIQGEWIKPGAIVLDVGINRIPAEGTTETGEPKTRLVGDVARQAALSKAAAITPVPGGVGPMTIAMLMANTLRAAKMRVGL
ncbi:bifunctional 5,10-methylenetetrahydrofolate dehydrogenase/5,10-methenyltetrahydrofolate cyclohydrolase [Beijerinckia mobilis]|uniref:bifunctional 5,10-methylenetetrahydrofolate dehydrogenase/5,10-methenyltetrahydrofolate cyclohydrolase n=1 Tax=Beijerinckia mobilis TaxID=231434 RepID=UPI0009FF1A36|nr:bifunctional methylenetetrahydrofolate dehydrogenase/methenyltetrahydrofolate cyclohydrolase FolD [Beijerinckia mobilis]